LRRVNKEGYIHRKLPQSIRYHLSISLEGLRKTTKKTTVIIAESQDLPNTWQKCFLPVSDDINAMLHKSLPP
jgi:hypothetical protein